MDSCGSYLIIVALYSDWRLLLAWLAMICVMGVVIPLQLPFLQGEEAAEEKKKKGIEDTSKVGKAEASANKIIGDAVMGIRTVAAFNLEQRFYEEFAGTTGRIASLQKGDALKGGFFMGLSDFVMMLAMGVVFWYSVWLANQGLVTFEDVMSPMWAIMGVRTRRGSPTTWEYSAALALISDWSSVLGPSLVWAGDDAYDEDEPARRHQERHQVGRAPL